MSAAADSYWSLSDPLRLARLMALSGVPKETAVPKKLQELTAADFPGVDPGRFEQWKGMNSTVAKRIQYAMWAIVAAVIVQFLVGGIVGGLIFVAVLITWFAVMLGHIRPLRLKWEAFGREIGIDDAALLRVGIDTAKAKRTRRTVLVVVLIAGAATIGLVLALAYLVD